MAVDLKNSVGRLIPSRSLRWQLATRWGAYEAYLQHLRRNLGSVRVPGGSSVDLETTFIPLRLTRWTEERALRSFIPTGTTPSKSLEEALAEHARVVLTGPKGTGKSALLRWRAISAARDTANRGLRSTFDRGGPALMPIYVPLADQDADVDLEPLILRTAEAAGLQDAEDFVCAHLESGRAIVLFDDLDTFPRSALAEVAARIGAFLDRYPGVQAVAATRDIADAQRFQGFATFEVAGVDPSRVESLAAKWGYANVASASGFLQVIERLPLVRSLVARPGWLAAGLSNLGPEHIRAFDIVDGLVRFIEPEIDERWGALASTLHRAHTAVGAIDLVPEPMRRSGLLSWLSEETFCLVHPAVQVYLTATASDPADADTARDLIERADDPWWRMVVVLSAGHMAEATAGTLVSELLESGHPQLAALALAERPDPDPSLVGAIQIELLRSFGGPDDDADNRARAIALAAVAGGEPVGKTGVTGPPLEVLDNGQPHVRAAAAAALGRIGDPAAIAPLLSALGDPDPEVRRAVSEALARFGERTIQPLVRQLSVPDDDIRLAARHGLAQHGGRAVQALVPLLESSSATQRTEAAEALAAIGAPAVPKLLEAISGGASNSPVDGELAARAAAEALTQIGAVAVRALVELYSDADPALCARIADILRAIGPSAVDALASMSSDQEDPHSASAAGLVGEMPDAGPDAAAALVRGLADERFEVRWAARRSLRRLDGAARDMLLAALDEGEPRVRWEAAQILLAMEDPPLERLRPALAGRLASESAGERRQAVRALGELRNPIVRELLEQALDDKDAIVRRSAATYLGQHEDSRSAAALARRWQEEEDPETSRAILEAISHAGPEDALPTLIEALAHEDKRIRVTACDILGVIGEPAVIPLIQALNARPNELDLEAALDVLSRAGSSARPDGHTPANVARVYQRLVVEPLEIDELVYLASTIEWWPPALELHRTFTAVKQFLECKTLGGIAAAVSALEWIDDVEDWLRPGAQKALRQLRLISQAVQYYNRGGTRSAKEKGLLTATARSNELRSMVGELGRPHDRIFNAVAEHWGGLINVAIRELQGRADLDVELRTEHVRIRDEDTTAVLVFELMNKGEGLASNVQLSIDTDDEELELQSVPTHFLPPLGQGDRLTAEFTVSRSGAGIASIAINVKYDDPQNEGLTRTFNREIRFFVEEAEYREIGKSPYIAGPPVKSREMFYGRHSTFAWVQENLSGTYQDNVLVLYGERRTGKTSVLYQLQHHLPEIYAFVLIDLQSIAYALGSTADVLYAMARKSISGLRRHGFDLERPEREEYAEHPIEQFEQLGELIGRQALALERRAVLIVDEFDLLIEAVEDGQVSPYVFDCIRGLMQHQDGLSFIFTGANKVSEMLRNPQSILFNTALRRKVSFLAREEAERLIREPVADVLWYDDLALEKILRATAGHPYFIQYICHEIVNIARHDQKNFVTLRDVDRALQTTVQETTGIIRHAYISLDMEERLALAAMSRITDDGRPFVGLDDILETLSQDDVTLAKRDAFEIMRHLAERDFVSERGTEGAGRQYGFTMEIVRVWLEQNDEYSRLLEEIRHE